MPEFPLSAKAYLLSTARSCPMIAGDGYAGRHFFKAYVMRFPRAPA